jgi:hypothetical protein
MEVKSQVERLISQSLLTGFPQRCSWSHEIESELRSQSLVASPPMMRKPCAVGSQPLRFAGLTPDNKSWCIYLDAPEVST